MPPVSLQSPLLSAALRRTTALPIHRCIPAPVKSTTARTFSNLPALRLTLTTPSSIFRAPNSNYTTLTTFLASTPIGEVLDVLAKSSVTLHPVLAGCASQIRCGPRPTMSGASRLIQKHWHGFLARKRTRGGCNMLKRRQVKGHERLSHG
ncbi:hypothetical protein P885DRAFT_59894 [Corynascus similis CBS 632.67]